MRGGIMRELQDWYQQRLLDEVEWAFALEAGPDATHPREKMHDAQHIEIQPLEPASFV